MQLHTATPTVVTATPVVNQGALSASQLIAAVQDVLVEGPELLTLWQQQPVLGQLDPIFVGQLRTTLAQCEGEVRRYHQGEGTLAELHTALMTLYRVLAAMEPHLVAAFEVQCDYAVALETQLAPLDAQAAQHLADAVARLREEVAQPFTDDRIGPTVALLRSIFARLNVLISGAEDRLEQIA